MHSDLRVIDPGFTTAYITRDHGYMVYDTLLATDANFKIQPQMADWKVSDDKLTYTFTLRDGLKWHDGTPVTAEDCVASLKRWGRNDGMGQKLMDFTASLEAPDAKTIVLKLKEPYGLVLESIGKPSSLVPFMMPKRLAETPQGQQIPEQIGSGPFKFVKAEFQPGVKAVYEKNTDYVPRKEPASWTSGGKVVKVDRVEWITMADAQTAVNALQSGDIDFMEAPPYDLLPVLEANPDLKIDVLNKFGFQTLGRMNFLNPPFDNVKVRRASQKPVKEGGWNMFFTNWVGADVANPVVNVSIGGRGTKGGWFGWAEDAEIEKLRDAYARASSQDEQKKIATEIQKLNYERVIYIPLGQYLLPSGWRKSLTGVLDGPATPIFWNIDKSE